MVTVVASAKGVRKGVSPVVAELILLVIAVVVGYVLYGQAQDIIAQLTSNPKPPSVITIDAAGLNPGSSYCLFAAVRNMGGSETKVVGFMVLDASDQSLIEFKAVEITIPPDSTVVVSGSTVCFSTAIGPSGSIRLLKVVTSDGASSVIKLRVP